MNPHPIDPVITVPKVSMLAEPVPLLSAQDLDATAAFWESFGARTGTDGRRLTINWDGATVDYEPAQRSVAPRITYGVGFIWHVDLDAVLTLAIENGLWTVTTAAVHDRQDSFEQRLAAGRSIARIGLPRPTPTDGVWECWLFDPDNNLLRLVAGPPQHPTPPGPNDAGTEPS